MCFFVSQIAGMQKEYGANHSTETGYTGCVGGDICIHIRLFGVGGIHMQYIYEGTSADKEFI